MMIIVYEANSAIDANIVQDILAMDGINSHVMGGLLQGGVGELQPFGLIKVMAADEDFDAARKIIVEWEEEMVEPEDNRMDNNKDDSISNQSNESTFLIGGFIVACLIGFMYISAL